MKLVVVVCYGEREALWRVVVETKYGSLEGGWCSKEVVGPFGVCVCVCMCVEMYKEGVGIFYKFVSYEVGDGSQVRFWHDL